MSPILIVVVSILAGLQLILPKRLAFIPLIIAGLHVGNLEILPQLSTGRIVILIGLGRALASGYLPRQKTKIDGYFIAFSALALASSIGHEVSPWVPSPFRARLGLVLNVVGSYLYARAFLPDRDTFLRFIRIIPFVLAPLAIGMTIEQSTRQSPYYALGARSESVITRDDRARARGPFGHPILAGTAGATALPLCIYLFQGGARTIGAIGMVSSLAIVLSSASSGPLAALAIGVIGAFFWRWRAYTKLALVGTCLLLLIYPAISGKGPWYLMAKIDLVGGSTGWHRAKLIDQAVHYLNEWWLFGSDYTRHWMATGVSWSPNMVDLTNYYIHLGVTGGIGLTICLVSFIWISLRSLFQRMKELRTWAQPDERLLWFVAVSLMTHAISFISISYFDQMYIYFYVLIGAIPGLVATCRIQPYCPSHVNMESDHVGRSSSRGTS